MINFIFSKRKIFFLLLSLFFAKSSIAQFTFGFGMNFQNHRTKVLIEELSIEEVDKSYPVIPGVFIAQRLKKIPFELSLDITYIRYAKSHKTNINPTNPNIYDEITTGSFERVPVLIPKVNYQFYKYKKIKLDANIGATYSFQFIDQTLLSEGKTADNNYTFTFVGSQPTYSRANFLIGLQTTFEISSKLAFRINAFNVFGGKQYLFKDRYEVTDMNGKKKVLEYGIFGGFSCIDFKLAFTL